MTTRFFVKPGENELIKTEVAFKPECRSVLHGTVIDPEGKAVQEALIMLFLFDKETETSKFSVCAFTDEAGSFAIGPLDAGQVYEVKVYKNNVKVRELEIITP